MSLVIFQLFKIAKEKLVIFLCVISFFTLIFSIFLLSRQNSQVLLTERQFSLSSLSHYGSYSSSKALGYQPIWKTSSKGVTLEASKSYEETGYLEGTSFELVSTSFSETVSFESSVIFLPTNKSSQSPCFLSNNESLWSLSIVNISLSESSSFSITIKFVQLSEDISEYQSKRNSEDVDWIMRKDTEEDARSSPRVKMTFDGASGSNKVSFINENGKSKLLYLSERAINREASSLQGIWIRKKKQDLSFLFQHREQDLPFEVTLQDIKFGNSLTQKSVDKEDETNIGFRVVIALTSPTRNPKTSHLKTFSVSSPRLTVGEFHGECLYGGDCDCYCGWTGSRCHISLPIKSPTSEISHPRNPSFTQLIVLKKSLWDQILCFVLPSKERCEQSMSLEEHSQKKRTYLYDSYFPFKSHMVFSKYTKEELNELEKNIQQKIHSLQFPSNNQKKIECLDQKVVVVRQFERFGMWSSLHYTMMSLDLSIRTNRTLVTKNPDIWPYSVRCPEKHFECFFQPILRKEEIK